MTLYIVLEVNVARSYSKPFRWLKYHTRRSIVALEFDSYAVALV